MSYIEPTDKSVASPRRLHIIRDFPFDPNRRLSSSVALLQTSGGHFQLWQFTKGSPDTVKNLCGNEPNIGLQAEELEMQGYRTIALCGKDISSSDVSRTLFPDGLSAEPSHLVHARLNGAQVHRMSFENTDKLAQSDPGCQFYGFCCFDASVRPSSKRVIGELSNGGIGCKMLTGDSLNAALSVASKVGLIQCSNIAVLDVEEDTNIENGSLVFRLLKTQLGKDGSFAILTKHSRTLCATMKTMKKVLRLHSQGKCDLVSNGKALGYLLHGNNDFILISATMLSSVAVVARATPDLKERFVDSLQRLAKKSVMMCGTLHVRNNPYLKLMLLCSTHNCLFQGMG
jgi:magnesium-transporting ATPase (P-type)